jgi:pentatricopeptide repeat protein
MYNSLVNGLCHDDRFPEPMKWLKVMFGEGLVPDLIVYTSVIASGAQICRLLWKCLEQ